MTHHAQPSPIPQLLQYTTSACHLTSIAAQSSTSQQVLQWDVASWIACVNLGLLASRLVSKLQQAIKYSDIQLRGTFCVTIQVDSRGHGRQPEDLLVQYLELVILLPGHIETTNLIWTLFAPFSHAPSPWQRPCCHGSSLPTLTTVSPEVLGRPLCISLVRPCT